MKKILFSMFITCLALANGSFAQTIALTQNFESVTIPALPAGWTNSATGGGDGWVTNSGIVNWPVSPLPAHSNYCYVNDYAHYYNDPSYLTSPVFSLVGVPSPYLSYDYYFIQAFLSSGTSPHEQAWVEISNDGGTTYRFVDSIAASGSSIPLPWATNFANLSAVSGFTETATCVLRFCYTDQGGITGTGASGIIGVAIDNIQVYGAVADFIGLSSVTPVAGAVDDYFLVGTNATFGGVVTNFGSSAVTSFTASYQVGAGTPVTSTISTSIAPFSTGTFSIPTLYTVPTASEQNVSVWVSETGATYLHLDTLPTSIYGYAFTPVKKELFEEATGSWCGFCVRGLVYMDSLWKLDSATVSIVSVHDYDGYDKMAEENTRTESYDNYISSKISGYPSMVIDRRYTDDPSGALTDHASDLGLFGFVNMGVTVTTSGGITAAVQVQPALNMIGSYQLEMVVEEDGVTDPGDSGYCQHDYYSYQDLNEALFGCGYNFQDSVEVMSARSIKFPFVDRYTVPDVSVSPNGVPGSLPDTMIEGSTYTYTFTPVAIQTSTLAWVPNNLRVVVLLIDNNPASSTYGQVLNTANSMTPFYFLGLANVNNIAIEGMTVFPNPANGNAHVTFGLSADAGVQLSVYDVLGREVYSMPSQHLNAGAQQLSFSTSDFAPGIYNVVINTGACTETRRLSVIK